LESGDGALDRDLQADRDVPRHELFGITSQMRRAAVSIPANVAEGQNRRRNAPYRNHVGIAMGSQAELDTLLELAVRLGYSPETQVGPVRALAARVGQMLGGLYRSLKNSEHEGEFHES
jgi:four helix bundle protein